jgi:protoporphyrinogen oxidase
LADILPAGQSNLSDLLARIPAVDVAVANLEYDGQVIPSQWRQAFGYLVPSHQSSKILGTVFDSSTFPELDREDKLSTRLTVNNIICHMTSSSSYNITNSQGVKGYI